MADRSAFMVTKFLFEWVEKNGIFIALDDYYDSIIALHFVEDDGEEQGPIRPVKPLCLENRPITNFP